MQLERLSGTGESEVWEGAASPRQEAFESAREDGEFRGRWVPPWTVTTLGAFQLMGFQLFAKYEGRSLLREAGEEG